MKLTKRAIDAIEIDPDREQVFWDVELSGFGLRVKATGAKCQELPGAVPESARTVTAFDPWPARRRPVAIQRVRVSDVPVGRL